ncbi:hypothetical protein CVE34_04705 [Pseudomonas syringae pv. actinidiae]|nr:hypothetical protein IYO_003735 [Pseudomonas syringae pv. actinidiae ICMP 18884]AOE55157.1 hypothetical protein NZ708_03730 [Pseudomonas syringae pv. actinidiae ICMP 18708]APP96019.1 hypothetical protein PsaNZ45_03730 [Pseudomonas syringae pv. actinidiae]AQL35883.1 hypothetical protein JN853_04960 [Pseudomonas syringae pv. actinidiae ICMP 9853]AYL79199.1 hypothetical protein CN228_03930 [Pseudomonas syringae pv. actinidiae str. Shaanxi_M228]
MLGGLTIQPVLSPQIISISEFTICLLGYRKRTPKPRQVWGRGNKRIPLWYPPHLRHDDMAMSPLERLAALVETE